jgi:hypothetical protein
VLPTGEHKLECWACGHNQNDWWNEYEEVTTGTHALPFFNVQRGRKSIHWLRLALLHTHKEASETPPARKVVPSTSVVEGTQKRGAIVVVRYECPGGGTHHTVGGEVVDMKHVVVAIREEA